MTDREKLVDLINEGVEIYSDGWQKQFGAAEAVADHLIANGVTMSGKRIECTFSIPIDGQEILRKAIEETEVDGKTLAEWIALLKDYKQHEWIRVEDSMPTESDGTVLVCFPDKSPYNCREHYVDAKHDMRVRTAHYSQFSDEWYIGDMAGVGGTRPTHWMPLPEPPKEDKQADGC
jgi:hypothetical protein